MRIVATAILLASLGFAAPAAAQSCGIGMPCPDGPCVALPQCWLQFGICISIYEPAGTPCGSGLVCDGSGNCIPDDPNECDVDSDCDDGNPCTVNTCETQSFTQLRFCQDIPLAAGEDCFYRSECDGAGACVLACPDFPDLPEELVGVIYRHQGATDPQDCSEGWWPVGAWEDTSRGPISDDEGSGFDAWFVDDAGASTGLYWLDVGTPEIDASAAHGWILRIRLRVVAAPDALDQSIRVRFADGADTHQMRFGAEADGDPIVQLSVSGQSVVLEGLGGGYHLYELVFDPSTATADLFVDGIERLSDEPGFPSPQGPNLSWGSAGPATTGRGHYSLVEWEILSLPPLVPSATAPVRAVIALMLLISACLLGRVYSRP